MFKALEERLKGGHPLLAGRPHSSTVSFFQLSLSKYAVMKFALSAVLSLMCLCAIAGNKDSVAYYSLPDSVTATALIADINIQSAGKREVFAGIRANEISLVMERDRNEREIAFEFPAGAPIIAAGINVEKDKGEAEWNFDWQFNTTYKLLIASSSDSAGNFTIYSGYIFLPDQQKWKLIATCKINGERAGIKKASTIFSVGNKSTVKATVSNTWCQRISGSWKKLDEQPVSKPPVINPLPNVDSVEQYRADKALIEQSVTSGKSDVSQSLDGVYYKIISPGSGKSFTVADSVTVHYQLRIFGTPEVISGSATESYTFPLRSLIKAWQIAVPLVRTGGKIKLVIPSGLGYSIRTRAPMIPPNSILEFEVEVLDSKPGK
jgi:FKBP-type peptidyl-prolyl cis-trans isomerase FkpA